jgi:hypothetical protein
MDSSNLAPSDRTAASTLYDALIAANHTLYYDHTSSSILLPTQIVFNPIPMEVMHWDEFDIQFLTEAYGDTLSSSLETQRSDSFPDPPQISGLNDLKSACECHTFPLIRQAIIRGTEDIVGRLDQRMPRVETVRDDQIAFGYCSGLSVRLRDTSVSTAPARLVVSCFYHARAWQSSLLLQEPTPRRLAPLQRLAKYCLLANTRYGFIFTGAELVVVRVSGTTARHPVSPCRVEWRSIPWNVSGPGVLTVKLSLWSLVMMSLHTQYRAICTPERILPLNLWWQYRNCEGREVFRHHLSMREVFQRPNGAVVEDMDLNL